MSSTAHPLQCPWYNLLAPAKASPSTREYRSELFVCSTEGMETPTHVRTSRPSHVARPHKSAFAGARNTVCCMGPPSGGAHLPPSRPPAKNSASEPPPLLRPSSVAEDRLRTPRIFEGRNLFWAAFLLDMGGRKDGGGAHQLPFEGVYELSARPNVRPPPYPQPGGAASPPFPSCAV